MILGARTAAWSGKTLPYDAEVEWIGNNSNYRDVRIDTGWLVKEHDEFFAMFSVNVFSSWIAVFNVTNSDSQYDMAAIRMRLRNQIALSFCASSAILHTITDFNGMNIVRMSFDSATVNDVDYQFSRSTYTLPRDPIHLFCQVTNGSFDGVRHFNGKLYSFSIKRSGVLSLDLIPVRFTNENGVSEGAMYDRVSGKLFQNSGTDAFVIGPDKTT